MGTGKSHTGSSKEWDSVADDSDLRDWLDSLPDAAPLGSGEPPAIKDGSDFGDETIPTALPGKTLFRIAHALRSQSDGPGTGGGAFPARAGGRTAAGIAAYGRRDADALDEMGLSLSDLDALEDDWDRAVAIADAAVGEDPSGADDEDARWAAAQTATWALRMEPPPETREIIERFVADYVYRKVSYQIGASLRADTENGADSYLGERSLRAGIRICVRSEIDADFSATTSTSDLTDLVTRVFEHTLTVWGEP